MNSLYLHFKVATPLEIDKVSLRNLLKSLIAAGVEDIFEKITPQDVCQAQFDDWRSLMTVSECPQCLPPEKLSMLCQHLRVSGDQEDGGEQSPGSLRRSLQSWNSSADFKTDEDIFQRLRAACNRELLSLALTGSSFSDSFSTLFKYSPLRNWGRDESSLNKLKLYNEATWPSQCGALHWY